MSIAKALIISAVALTACRSDSSHQQKDLRATEPESFSTQDPYTAEDIRTRGFDSDSDAWSDRNDSYARNDSYGRNDSNRWNDANARNDNRSGTAEESFSTNESYSGNVREAGATVGAAAFSTSERDFITKWSHCGAFEVQSSQLALQKGITGQTREFAEMMIADHGQVNRELERIAQRRKLVLPHALDAKHETKLEELRELDGEEFAQQYHKVQKDGHEKMIDMLEQGARDSEDADVRALAKKALAGAKRHLEILNDMVATR